MAQNTLESEVSVESCQPHIRELEAEIERLRAIILEVAACGVEHDAGKYLTIQIDPETWAECRKEREGE